MSRKRPETTPAIPLAAGVLIAVAIAMSVPAYAGDTATDAQISAAVSDKTFQGSMLKDAFAEYYGADGSIRGKNYTGQWRVADNLMCFKYGDKPEVCWGLEINGPAVTLYKGDKVDGNGILIEGNPHKF